MTPSEILVLRYNIRGTKVFALGSKFLRVYAALDGEFKSIENIDVPYTLSDVAIT